MLVGSVTTGPVKIDVPVCAISVHGTVGLWGVLAAPLTKPGESFTHNYWFLLRYFSDHFWQPVCGVLS